MSNWRQLDVRAIGLPTVLRIREQEQLKRLVGERCCANENEHGPGGPRPGKAPRLTELSCKYRPVRSRLTAAKVTPPVKDMGANRHHEEYEAWCVPCRQKMDGWQYPPQ